MTLSHPKTFRGLYGIYELLEVLKSGRMATIWKGKSSQTQALVAIKLFHHVKWESSERLEKKLCREGLATKVLEHPSICKILDFFHTPEGHNGLVMEYLDGMDLSDFISHRGHRPFGVKGALKIIQEVTKALDYAHHLGDHNPELAARNYKKVLHQDIKPGNIFITRDNEIKLIDFGISRVESEEKEIQHMGYGFTRTYAAPDLWDENEEFLGEKYSENHDLYSLGLVFYELLTGQEAFKSIPQARRGNIKSLKSFGDFPPELLSFFEKWTNIDPEKRFQSTEELNGEIHRLSGLFMEEEEQDITQEIEIFRQKPFQTIKKTLMETMRSDSDKDSDVLAQSELLKLLLMTHLHLTLTPESQNASLLKMIQVQALEAGVPIKTSQVIDDRTLKSVYDIFRATYPTNATVDWVEFKEILRDREKFLEILQNVQSKKGRYQCYHEAFSILSSNNLSQAVVSSVLFDFRSGLDLDPFECDKFQKPEALTFALSGIALQRVMEGEAGSEQIHKFLVSNFKFPNTKTSLLVKSLQNFKSSTILNSSPKIEPVVKHAIYALLGKLAGADKDISVSERSVLEKVKISLGDKNLTFGDFKGKSINEIIASIPEGELAFVISKFLNLALSKVRLAESERAVFLALSEQVRRSRRFEHLTEAQFMILLEPLFMNALRLGHHAMVLKEVRSWFQIDQGEATEISAKLNLLRQIFDEPQLITKHLADITECLYGKKRQHNPGVPMLFLAEYYLFLHLKVIRNHPGYKNLLSNMMSSFRHPEQFQQEEFAYDLLKYHLKYHVEEGFFSSNLALSKESEEEIRRILYELKIGAEVLQDAIRRIKLHYNVIIKFGDIRKVVAA